MERLFQVTGTADGEARVSPYLWGWWGQEKRGAKSVRPLEKGNVWVGERHWHPGFGEAAVT